MKCNKNIYTIRMWPAIVSVVLYLVIPRTAAVNNYLFGTAQVTDGAFGGIDFVHDAYTQALPSLPGVTTAVAILLGDD
jgi:hypothetical protein